MNRLLSVILLSAVALGACGEPAQSDERRTARLERELRQARAMESLALVGPLETRTEDFNAAIAEVEARQRLQRELEEALAADDVAAVPAAPGHLVQACPFAAERTVCVTVPGEVSRNDEAGEERLVADYVERFKADGWRMIHGGPRPVLAKASHCARLEAIVWDDGKSARMKFQRILRVEFNPEGVTCTG